MTQLYDLAVPIFTQTVRAIEGALEKAEPNYGLRDICPIGEAGKAVEEHAKELKT